MTSRNDRAAREAEQRLQGRVDSVAAEGGLRVLRELGEGGTALVCLVVPLDTDPFGPLESSQAALKVPRFDAAGARVREDRILASVRSAHVVALLGTLGRGTPSSLLEYLPGGTLVDLLARREFLRVGEAVTILVSLVRALAAIHAAGYWHGSLAASKVMFAAGGRPVVVGLSHAVAVGHDPESSTSAASPDDDGFREIAALLARAVGDEAIVEGAGELAALARTVLPLSMDAVAWERLETEVFAIGRPEPVLLVPPSAPQVLRAGSAAEQVVGGVRRRFMDPSPFKEAPGIARLAGIGRALREKRKLVVYSAGCLLFAVVATVVVSGALPTDDSGSGGSAAASGPTETPAPAPQPEASGAPTGTSGPTPAASEAISPGESRHDEPVDAAERLLRKRFECFSEEPVDQRCLDAVLQPGSALDSSDRAELGARARSGSASERDFRDFGVSMIERMGDAALLALTPAGGSAEKDSTSSTRKPASLLIVRGEAGWRLRELFED